MTKKIKVAPYNKIAVQYFLRFIATKYPLPQFLMMYKEQQWEIAYEALTLDGMSEYADMVISTYNKAYELTLSTYN